MWESASPGEHVCGVAGVSAVGARAGEAADGERAHRAPQRRTAARRTAHAAASRAAPRTLRQRLGARVPHLARLLPPAHLFHHLSRTRNVYALNIFE